MEVLKAIFLMMGRSSGLLWTWSWLLSLVQTGDTGSRAETGTWRRRAQTLGKTLGSQVQNSLTTSPVSVRVVLEKLLKPNMMGAWGDGMTGNVKTPDVATPQKWARTWFGGAPTVGCVHSRPGPEGLTNYSEVGWCDGDPCIQDCVKEVKVRFYKCV